VSYHSLGNDLENVNFSSIRAGTLEEREAWKAIQGWVIEHFCNPVYSDWLKMALLRGRLANLPMSKFEKFNNPVWQPKRWPWVDPLKDIKAQEAAVMMGVKSVSDVIRETGRDPDEVWRELEKDITRLAPILAKLGQGKTAQLEVTNNVDQTN
jgi:lambda family phage portal protein